ncbi:ThiF family adenylyltransferase [Bacteroides uniformis]|nr:ThiF family adenylyltransferase [Bacteroides uniformis]MCM1630163.1 ThiF family adenylyltransferase [Bacteroides uniformis]MCM1633622.1 ThiF family adenylyltransferase [Bacteroides uniformis]MCM1667586.1 ThiF family adenylyltransferase [Bacteroides uniformis]MCM1703836.1 ThiF family adenylyltransferase [Bacteroides uniformis]MCM1842311.1 ThiF family adenylyltransferase [Bacteroides uniformis]
MMTADKIKELIGTLSGVILVDDFTIDEAGLLKGRIAVATGQDNTDLEWNVEISPTYPFKVMGSEPIYFQNKNLLDYPHIMQGGNLCMHPAEYENAESQFVNDLKQLKEWIDKYYVKEEKDVHYEHLVVNHYPIHKKYYTFCFAEIQEDFAEGDYGIVHYATLPTGQKNDCQVSNYVVQRFVSYLKTKKVLPCKISNFYQELRSCTGVYCLLNNIPSVYNKFIVEEYDSIRGLFSQSQKNYIHSFVVSHGDKYDFFPLFCGYKIPSGGVYWQAMLIFMEDLPIEPVRVGIGKNRVWLTNFKRGQIQWAETVDISYKYFFGRGAMPEELANKKMLIMGVGAIGSIIAETLTRCGAKNISLYDIDNKEPGNVCRSSYPFYTGITEKTLDMGSLLRQISPHVECTSLKPIVDLVIKSYAVEHEDKSALAGFFDEFDVIFDCTTDNQLMRVMDSVGAKAQLVNLSITNHAQDLICAFSPNVTETVLLIYDLLKRDTETDMYNPTGCWNPTFKASYNDIECKVQIALKHIIKMLSRLEPLSNFYITEDDLNLRINKL